MMLILEFFSLYLLHYLIGGSWTQTHSVAEVLCKAWLQVNFKYEPNIEYKNMLMMQHYRVIIFVAGVFILIISRHVDKNFSVLLVKQIKMALKHIFFLKLNSFKNLDGWFLKVLLQQNNKKIQVDIFSFLVTRESYLSFCGLI